MTDSDLAPLDSPTPPELGRRPRVLDVVRGQVSVEAGSVSGFDREERVAVLAQWSATPVLTRSFTTLAQELAAAGYRIVVSSACESPAPLEWSGRRPDGTVVLRRPNIGYDFGSWTVALDTIPDLTRADSVILVNDSLVGPFATLRPILDRVDENRADVVGLTDVRQFFRHLQSYFLRFSGGILADPPLTKFFADVRGEQTKWDIIRRYELGLTRLMRTEAYGFSPIFRADDFAPTGHNAVIESWWKLLEHGFPFVKREILRRPDVAPRADRVARQVLALYGQHIEEWI